MAIMARVVDSSAWIEWLTDSALGKSLAELLPQSENCVVPTIVQLELSKWLVRELGEDRANKVISYTSTCVVVPLTTEIALHAAELHRAYKLATADAIIYATARHLGVDLLTCDAHFAGLPAVTLVVTKSAKAL